MRLEFSKGLVNAPGFLGFTPSRDTKAQSCALDAFVTNPISAGNRIAATQRGSYAFPGGELIHSGYPNPGFDKALKLYADKWERAEKPIILSLVEADPKKLAGMVAQAEGIANLAAIQIMLAEDFSRELMLDLIKAAQGELPLIAHVPMERCLEMATDLIDGGAEAIAMGASRGEVLDEGGNSVSGRLVGPSQFPRAMTICSQLATQGAAVIGGCGVFESEQVQQMLKAGALAVQLDAVLWRADWDSEAWVKQRN